MGTPTRSSLTLFALSLSFLTVCLSVVSLPMPAQTFYGSIVGAVTDASGGSVSGAAVTLTNIGTSGKRTAETDALGNYRFVDLLPGNYRLEDRGDWLQASHTRADCGGSSSHGPHRCGVAGGRSHPDGGSLGPEALLQTESASLGQVVESRTVQEMPLNGRNVLNLAGLVPGVVPQGNQADSTMGTPTGQQYLRVW